MIRLNPLEILHKISSFLRYFKYPLYLLALLSFGVIVASLTGMEWLLGKDWLFPALILLIWSLLLMLFPGLFADLPDFSYHPKGWVAKIKQFLHKALYYFFALLLMVVTLALLSLTHKMVMIAF